MNSPYNSKKKTMDNSSMLKSNLSLIEGSMSPMQSSSLVNTPKNAGLSYSGSASTLQYSPLVNKFSKAERFPPIKSLSQSHMPLTLQDTFSPKATSFGYGKKMTMSEAVMRTDLDIPSPGQYNPKPYQDKNQGKTFGLNYDAYKKVYLPHKPMVSLEVAKDLPGPGKYDLPDGFSPSQKGYTLKGRGKMFNEVTGERAPPSGYYNPKFVIAENSRFNKITFGVGDRTTFSTNGNRNPGPGSYQIPSKFDTYAKKKAVEDRVMKKMKTTKAEESRVETKE